MPSRLVSLPLLSACCLGRAAPESADKGGFERLLDMAKLYKSNQQPFLLSHVSGTSFLARQDYTPPLEAYNARGIIQSKSSCFRCRKTFNPPVALRTDYSQPPTRYGDKCPHCESIDYIGALVGRDCAIRNLCITAWKCSNYTIRNVWLHCPLAEQ